MSQNRIRQSVRDIARVASVMFDGELCGRIVTERSWQWFANFDPEDRWSAMDNYDLEHAPFVAAKQTLMRLERLGPAGLPALRVGCNLWLPVPTLPGQATCVIHNGGPDRWHKFADNCQELSAPMQAALAGQQTDVPDDESGAAIVTTLAPVRDSLKQVLGFIEVSAALADPQIPW
jgi:hypothetical protein